MIVFRAIRFALHLLLHHPRLLLRELRAFAASMAYWPAYRRMWREVPQRIEFRCSRPMAADSPDHLHPHGTAHNHATHFGFIVAMTRQMGPNASMLDLGCSSGRLVRDFRRVGWTAVGLEGSDYSLNRNRPCWDTEAGESLFTCDIGRPFNVGNEVPYTKHFDLITAFQVLEHLDKKRLESLMFHVELHSKPGTLFVISTSRTSEVINGVELHVTRWPREKWVEFFAEHLPKWRIGKPVPDHLMMRRSVEDLDFCLRRI